MLIEYPDLNYDTFCSLVDAETILLNYIQSSLLTDWNALSDTDKEALLRQSTLLIKQRVEVLPDTLENDLKMACAYLSNHSVSVDMTNEDGAGNVKIKEITGVVKTEWFNPKEDKSNEFPDVVESLLSGYDVVASCGFSFNRG